MTFGINAVVGDLGGAIGDGSDVTWRLAAPAKPQIRDWDGDYVVYNPLSGDTHILSIVAGEVLKLISAAPLSVSQVRQHIAAFLQVPDDDRIATHVGSILANLDEMGLIELSITC